MLYLDDALPTHPKILAAGKLLGGPFGRYVALGAFVTAVGYARKHATDGAVPVEVVDGLVGDRRAIRYRLLSVSDALVRAGLCTKSDDSLTIHDYHHWNPTAEAEKARQLHERTRKAKWRADKKAAKRPAGTQQVSRWDNDGTATGPSGDDPKPKPIPSTRAAESAALVAREPDEPPVIASPTGDSLTVLTPPVRPPQPAPRPAPLMQSPLALRNYAYPNDVVGVPNFSHAKYLQRLENAGATRVVAERTLFDWYDETCKQWRGQRIGDREADFWDKRFEEWQGRTPSAAAPTKQTVGEHNAEVLKQRRQARGDE